MGFNPEPWSNAASADAFIVLAYVAGVQVSGASFNFL